MTNVFYLAIKILLEIYNCVMCLALKIVNLRYKCQFVVRYLPIVFVICQNRCKNDKEQFIFAIVADSSDPSLVLPGRFVADRMLATRAVFLLSDIYTTTDKRDKMLPLLPENLRNVNKNSFDSTWRIYT